MKTSCQRALEKRNRKRQRRLQRKQAFSRIPHHSIRYEVSGRTSGISQGGVPALLELARAVGLHKQIDSSLALLKERRPYSESDHILALVATLLAGGSCPEDQRLLRNKPEMLDAFGFHCVPAPTTAGDFLRRFTPEQIHKLQQIILQITTDLLKQRLPAAERRLALIDADGTMSPTDAECMEGIDYSGHKKLWGYHPLLVSLANIFAPLWIINRPGNRTSAEGAAEALNIVTEQMLTIYERALLRGDTDFSQCTHLDRWDGTGRIDFVFGFDAKPNLVALAEALPRRSWKRLVPRERVIKTRPRTKPERIKEKLVEEKGWKTLKTEREDLAEFDYQPAACRKSYRMVVLRKTIRVTEGQTELLPETRYFFYITNLKTESAEEVVRQARHRCDQENLIAQLKGQVPALSPVSNTLVSNWAWMVVGSLAWTLKSWFALFTGTERRRVQRMEYKGFGQRLLQIPVQVVRQARRTVLRVIGGDVESVRTLLGAWKQIRRVGPLRS